MKRVILLTIMVLSFAMVGCEPSQSTASKEKAYTEALQQQSLDMVGFPDIINFFERGQLKEIYEKRDDPNTIMFWYTKNEMSGKWVYEGKCIGYGIPYGASMTSPEKSHRVINGVYTNLPLAEPNGLYTNGVTSSATWVLTIDDSGKVNPSYVENTIRVSPFKIRKELVETFSLPTDY